MICIEPKPVLSEVPTIREAQSRRIEDCSGPAIPFGRLRAGFAPTKKRRRCAQDVGVLFALQVEKKKARQSERSERFL